MQHKEQVSSTDGVILGKAQHTELRIPTQTFSQFHLTFKGDQCIYDSAHVMGDAVNRVVSQNSTAFLHQLQ